MSIPQIFESEYRFCLILWEHEPVNSTQLVHLCQEKLGWSKATTYTVIRRLSQRGVVKSENAVVTSPPDTAVPAAVSTSPEIGSVVGTRLTPAWGSRSPGHSSRTATMAHRP